MAVTAAEAFQTWCAFLVPTEGGLSMDANDRGNWTGGTVGVGELKGSKFGISAAAHPTLDIANLTSAQADSLRKTEYWDKVNGDALPPPVAFILADSAYQSGPGTAVRQFQHVLGVPADGIVGTHETIPAVELIAAAASKYQLKSGLEDLVTEFASRRLLFEASLPIWTRYEGGWTRRLFHAVVIALSLVCVLLALLGPAVAAPPAGADPDSPVAAWYRSLRSEADIPCCSLADCRNVPSRWASDHFEAFIGATVFGEDAPDKYLPVPAKAVLHLRNPTGDAVACYHSGEILCFVPGPGI